MKTHQFDIVDAELYGVVPAVILWNIRHWVKNNKTKNRHYYEGAYWTYNSVNGFTELFPYLTAKQIRTALDTLINTGIVKVGHFNKYGADRTRWFAIDEDAASNRPERQKQLPKRANGSAQKGKSEVPKRAKAIAQKGKPIPDDKPDSKPDVGECNKAVVVVSENPAASKPVEAPPVPAPSPVAYHQASFAGEQVCVKELGERAKSNNDLKRWAYQQGITDGAYYARVIQTFVDKLRSETVHYKSETDFLKHLKSWYVKVPKSIFTTSTTTLPTNHEQRAQLQRQKDEEERQRREQTKRNLAAIRDQWQKDAASKGGGAVGTGDSSQHAA